jgi:hypothetical protein
MLRVVNDMDQFRVEEEMARLVGDKETAEAENKNLKKRLKTLQEHFVGIQTTLPVKLVTSELRNSV